MTWLTLRALLRRVPAVAWIIAGCALALIIAGLSIYHAGATHAVVQAHRHALADSIDKETIVSDIVKEQHDSARAVARFAKKQADETRGRRNLARDAVTPLLDSLPEVVVTLIRLDDQLIRRDSVALTAYMAADTAAMRVREIATELDLMRQHQAKIGVPAPKSHRALYVLAGVGLTLAGAFLVHAVR